MSVSLQCDCLKKAVDERHEYSVVLCPEKNVPMYQRSDSYDAEAITLVVINMLDSDLNDHLVKATGRKGEVTTYEYDALNRVTAMHRPNGISTYTAYNARDQITTLVNKCDHCGWILSSYSYVYDERGFITGEHAEEAQEADSYGRDPHTPYKPGQLSEDCSHGKTAGLSYRLVKTDCTFLYDDAGKLLSSTETVQGCGTTRYEYGYDLTGNRTSMTKKNDKGVVVENRRFMYNENSQLVESMICDGRKVLKWRYTYDADGNLIRGMYS